MTSLARQIKRGRAIISKDYSSDEKGRLYVTRVKGSNKTELAVAEQQKNLPAMKNYIQGITLPRIHKNKLKTE